MGGSSGQKADSKCLPSLTFPRFVVPSLFSNQYLFWSKSMNQQKHHGADLKHRILGPALNLLNQDLLFNTVPRRFVCTSPFGKLCSRF